MEGAVLLGIGEWIVIRGGGGGCCCWMAVLLLLLARLKIWC
jgi:hypothetical protein